MYLYCLDCDVKVTIMWIKKSTREYVIYRVHVSASSRWRVRGVLMVKTLNKCSLSIVVYILFLDTQRIIYIHRNISIHRYIGCLGEIEIQIHLGETNRLDTRIVLSSILWLVIKWSNTFHNITSAIETVQ